MSYRTYVDFAEENPGLTHRSLAQAVKYLLSSDLGGIVQLPNKQNVMINPRGGTITVSHGSHGYYDDDDRIDEESGIRKVAKVVKRFAPKSHVIYRQGEMSDLETMRSELT